ncbi:MAG: SurA N-terminal domain-containing protein [Dietzia sp.]|nr:SurA N-terminal domain-containing protein [Dietzia sp.]
MSKDEFVTVFEGQYQQMAMQAQMTGQPVDEDQLRSQTLEGLVGSELLRQEALERGLEVSDAELEPGAFKAVHVPVVLAKTLPPAGSQSHCSPGQRNRSVASILMLPSCTWNQHRSPFVRST